MNSYQAIAQVWTPERKGRRLGSIRFAMQCLGLKIEGIITMLVDGASA
jgi:hypothetical protein